MERRSASRCPICQGPAVADDDFPEGVKCRRSTCVHNHSHHACPRCKHQDLDHVTFENGLYVLTCKECTHTWKLQNT